MEREKFILNNSQWQSLVYENYFDLNGVEIDFNEIEFHYDGSSRHTEAHHKILKRISDGKYFRVHYETSVKDSMGWEECNSGNTVVTEVFPESKTITVYK